MALHTEIKSEVHALISYLIETGIADDQNATFERHNAKNVEITFTRSLPFAESVLRERPYADMYWDERKSRSFTALLLDGAMLQLSYDVAADAVVRHRLAFLPSPTLVDYQSHPELYLEELFFTDVIDKRVLPVPIRFDFDARSGVAQPLVHPTSHLTLGQYSRCRIPVRSAISPGLFVAFVLQNFYNTAFEDIARGMPATRLRFSSCLHTSEAEVIHIGAPSVL